MKFGTKMQKAAGCETNNLGGKGGIFDGNAKLFSILIYIFFCWLQLLWAPQRGVKCNWKVAINEWMISEEFLHLSEPNRDDDDVDSDDVWLQLLSHYCILLFQSFLTIFTYIFTYKHIFWSFKFSTLYFL